MASIHIHICKGLKTQELHVRPGGKEGLRFMLANSRVHLIPTSSVSRMRLGLMSEGTFMQMSKPTAAELKREQKFREEQAELALNCPCLDKLRAGPCGKEFSRAFLCFLKSGHPEKVCFCAHAIAVFLVRPWVCGHDPGITLTSSSGQRLYFSPV